MLNFGASLGRGLWNMWFARRRPATVRGTSAAARRVRPGLEVLEDRYCLSRQVSALEPVDSSLFAPIPAGVAALQSDREAPGSIASSTLWAGIPDVGIDNASSFLVVDDGPTPQPPGLRELADADGFTGGEAKLEPAATADGAEIVATTTGTPTDQLDGAGLSDNPHRNNEPGHAGVAPPRLSVAVARQEVSQTLGGPAPLPFVIRTAVPSSGNLIVKFDVTTIDRTGQVNRTEGSAMIPAGAHQVAISPGALSERPDVEIILLTLRGNAARQTPLASATQFVPGGAQRCSDAALLQAYCQARSEESFAALVERYQPGVLRVCQRILGNLADAEDVCQSVFVFLATKPLRFVQPLSGWLHTVARHAAISFMRSRTRRIHHEAQAARKAEVDNQPPPGDWIDEVAKALTRLPARFQQAVRLRYLEDYSQRDAAQLVGCPRGTLAQRAARGVMQLRNLLQNVMTGT